MAPSQPAEPSSLNFNDLMHLLSEFCEILDLPVEAKVTVEVAVHYIVYVRDVYPADLFDKYKKYSVPVFKSRHPKLNEYIAQVVKSAMEQIALGHVKKFIVAIKDESSDETLEQFVFNLTWLKPPNLFKDESAKRKYASGVTKLQLDLHLRAFLLKLTTVEAQLGPMPSDLSFSVYLEIADDAPPPIEPDKTTGDAAPWLPARMEEERQIDPDDSYERLHSLKKTPFGVLDLEIDVEEHHQKAVFLERENLRIDAMDQDELPKIDKGKGRAS